MLPIRKGRPSRSFPKQALEDSSRAQEGHSCPQKELGCCAVLPLLLTQVTQRGSQSHHSHGAVTPALSFLLLLPAARQFVLKPKSRLSHHREAAGRGSCGRGGGPHCSALLCVPRPPRWLLAAGHSSAHLGLECSGCLPWVLVQGPEGLTLPGQPSGKAWFLLLPCQNRSPHTGTRT